MISTVYIAAPMQMRDEAAAVREELKERGIDCTSHWIDGQMPTDVEAARRDFNDILNADAIAFLNPKSWSTSGTGGRHTEVSFALALRIPIFLVGRPSNVFHTLPEVTVLATTSELIDMLHATMPVQRHPMTHAEMIHAICARVHKANQKWWIDLETGQPLKRNVGELLMLVCTELAEAMEGHRKNLPDDKLPHRRMFEVELADALIRIADICGGFALDLGGAFEEKMDYNAVRVDHTHAHRLSEHGKKY